MTPHSADTTPQRRRTDRQAAPTGLGMPMTVSALITSALLLGALAIGGLALFGLLAVLPGTAHAQNFAPAPAPLGSIPQAVSVDEIRRIIQVAREAGFTEEQVAEITIEDQNGNVVRALEYLERLEREQAERLAREKALREKRYLTVQDVFAELREHEGKDLDVLRERYILTQ